MGSKTPLSTALPEEVVNRNTRSLLNALNSAATFLLLLALAAIPALAQGVPGQDPLVNEEDASLRQGAVDQFQEATGYSPRMLEAYAG